MRLTPRQSGFTLAEALLAATILAMTVTAITMPFTAGARSQAWEARRSAAVSLAEEMMEEVLSKPFADPDGDSQPGPENGEAARSDFDNVDDYHGYSEAAGQVQDLDGVAVSDEVAALLSRHVSTTYVYVGDQDTGVDPTFIRVVVELRVGSQTVATLTRLVYDP